jgi:hypothetical protein
MKKLLFILTFFVLTNIVKGQDVAPTDTSFHAIPTYSLKYQTTTKRPWIDKGPKYGKTELATHKQMRAAVDSTYSHTYEVEVTTPGVSTYTVPAPLKAKTMVFYNGNLIRSALWSGVGTTSLVVGVDINIYDYIKIQY